MGEHQAGPFTRSILAPSSLDPSVGGQRGSRGGQGGARVRAVQARGWRGCSLECRRWKQAGGGTSPVREPSASPVARLCLADGRGEVPEAVKGWMRVGTRRWMLFLAGQLFLSVFPIYLSAPISLLIAAHIQVQLMRCECPAVLSLAAEARADVITGPAVLAPGPADRGAGGGGLQPHQLGATCGRMLIPGAKPARRQKFGPAGRLTAGQCLVLRCCNAFGPKIMQDLRL